MAEETPEAPVAAPASEANQPTNTQPEAPAQQPAEAPKAPAYEITDDQRRFIDSNGGWEKIFEKAKMAISRPEPAPEAPKTEAPTQPAQPAPQEPAQLNNRPAEGYLSPSDIAALQYRNMLASDSKYEKISDYVKSDGWMKEMKAMGMNPVDGQGNMNDRVIRQFLDLKASTVAAQQPATPVTSTPTVEYVEVGDTITDINKAYSVIQQNMQLAAAGKPEHPKTADAKKFIAEHFAARRSGGRK